MIRLQFIVGGGPFLTFDYLVIGGPDNGRRVELAPTRLRQVESDHARATRCSEHAYDYFDACLQTSARPCIARPVKGKGLAPETIEACDAELGKLGRGYNADGTVDAPYWEAFSAAQETAP